TVQPLRGSAEPSVITQSRTQSIEVGRGDALVSRGHSQISSPATSPHKGVKVPVASELPDCRRDPHVLDGEIFDLCPTASRREGSLDRRRAAFRSVWPSVRAPKYGPFVMRETRKRGGD